MSVSGYKEIARALVSSIPGVEKLEVRFCDEVHFCQSDISMIIKVSDINGNLNSDLENEIKEVLKNRMPLGIAYELEKYEF